jgi:galactokinase/mevalonate kinase-like predicted kinase
MNGSLIDELRIMAEEHDDELCREALNHIEMLKNANCEYRKALSQQQNASTLRDQFAMAALNGALAGRTNGEPTNWTKFAYECADAMMEARK